MSGVGDDDDDRRDQSLEGEGEENIGTMSNHRGEDEEENVEFVEEEEEEEEEENVEVMEEELRVDDGEEETVGVVPGKQQQQQLYQKEEVLFGEQENDDVDVDIDDEGDEPPQSSISVLKIDDPFSSASHSENSVFHTAAASSGTQLNTAGEDAASHGGPLSPPMGMPISTVPNTFIPPTEDTPTLAASEVADGVSPTVQIETGAEVFEVTTAAGVEFISSKQDDVPNPEIKQVDLMTPSTDADLASQNEDQAAPFDHLKEPPPPPNIDDEKSSSSLIGKNSIQESNLNLATEMENALRNLSSQQQQAPSDAPELKQTEQLLNVARTSSNQDDLMSDLGGAAQELEEDTFAEKDVEPSRSSNHDRHLNAFAGLDALTSAIDIGNARDALVKLQPNLNNGGRDGGGETAGEGGDSGEGRFEHQRQKTELELEMELYEVAERQEQARLLASIRDQPMPGDSNNDRKRASESAPNEARKKRGKKAIISDEPKEEEDVCFICFDGGELVLCDRRTCPKAYHLNCIGRDVAFFEKKGAWICGWHFCAICTKPANFQCYTCPTAYCASCLAQADFCGIRQRKGLCEECWPIVQMIENKETVNLAEGVEVDFTDQETYEGLFKEYWEDLKQRLSLTPEELDKDSKAGGSAAFLETGSDGEDRTENEDYVTESGNEIDEEEEQEEEEEDDVDAGEVAKKRRKRRGKAKAQGEAEGDEGDTDFGSDNDDDAMELGEEDADDQNDDGKASIRAREFDGWASKELIEFVKYMDEDPKKPLSRFQVTKLLWSYIKSQKLQDPRKKTHIVCDDRLRTIFGKKTVGQFEMFKHLQSHFAPKGRGRAGRQIRDEEVGIEEEGTDPDDTAADERLSRINVKDRRRKKKTEEDKFERPNLNEYAAVTPKNIGLIYLRRQLLEELLDDPEFDSKVCSTFVRIRVPGMISKSEMCYRLVQVVGTRLQAEHYKAGRKVTNYVLEILNLQKREDVTVDLVSNHEFSEEECQRLRQSMKYGFIKALTVGDIEDKAKSLQEAKVNDWFETERQRLVNLRDRASEKGRKKELRECVEKLQELNSPAFRAAKLHARPEVTADPRMDPDYKSDDNDEKAKDGMSKVLDKVHLSSPGDKVPPAGILKGHNESSREWESTKNKQSSWGDTYRSKEGDRLYDSSRSSDKLSYGRPSHNYGLESAKERGYEERERGWGTEQQNNVAGDAGWNGNGRNRPAPAQKWNEKVDLSINVDARSGRSDYRGITGMTTPVFDTKADWQSRREAAPPAAPSLPQGFPVPSPTVSTQAAIEAAEKEKIWHYTDPTGMMQGPFTMEQLRKWNATGYFPEDLRIWRTNQPREESILLTDGLAGRLQKEREPWGSTTRVGNPVVASIQEEIAQALTTSSTVPFNNNPALNSADGWRENGGASSWTDRGGSGDVGRSVSYGSQDVNPNNRIFARDAGSGPSASLRDSSIDLKWKPGPAGGAYDSYGRSSDNSFPARSGRADAAAKFDPANWPRSTSGRPERDSWGSSPAPGSDTGGYSNFGGRGSLGRGSNYRDSGGKWNPAESSGRESSRSSSRDALRASRKEIICRFHAKGYCKRGDSCDYWHG